MRKELLVGIISILFIVSIAAAEKGGKGHGMQKLELYQKCPNGEPCPWDEPSEWGDAFGRLSFSEYSYGFQAWGLEPGEDYTLIRYTDPWATHEVVCIPQWWTPYGEDNPYDNVADKRGKYHITGQFVEGGPKVWLVLSDDVNCVNGQMEAWNPAEYLFENNVIDEDIGQPVE